MLLMLGFRHKRRMIEPAALPARVEQHPFAAVLKRTGGGRKDSTKAGSRGTLLGDSLMLFGIEEGTPEK
jgi:hypothetical protein